MTDTPDGRLPFPPELNLADALPRDLTAMFADLGPFQLPAGTTYRVEPYTLAGRVDGWRLELRIPHPLGTVYAWLRRCSRTGDWRLELPGVRSELPTPEAVGILLLTDLLAGLDTEAERQRAAIDHAIAARSALKPPPRNPRRKAGR